MPNYTKNKSIKKVKNKATIESLANKLIKNGCLSKKENEQLLMMQLSKKRN